MNPTPMKKTLTLLALAAGIATHAQVIFTDGFESWTANLPDNWVGAKTNINTDSIEQVSTNVHGGSYACRLYNFDSGHKRFTTQTLTVVNGETYQVQFWVRGTGDIRVGLFDGRPGGTSGYAPYSTYTASSATWTQVTQNIVCANDTTGAEFILSVRESDEPENIVVDDVTITQGVVATPMSIYDIQYTTATDGSSPAVGMAVATGGIVTAHYDGGYWLQAGTGPWSGIFVNDTLTNAVEGDSITLEGVVEESFGLTRLNGVTNVIFEAGYPVPASAFISNSQAQQEAYESVLVTAQAVECTVDNAGFGQWVVNDGVGDSLIVDDLIYAFTPTLGALYTLTGPMYYSFSERKIEPRTAADIVAGIADATAPSFTVGPNPANAEFTIVRVSTGTIDWSLVDASGRTVVADRTSDDRITIDVRALQAGTYTVVLRGNSSTTARPLVIAR